MQRRRTDHFLAFDVDLPLFERFERIRGELVKSVHQVLDWFDHLRWRACQIRQSQRQIVGITSIAHVEIVCGNGQTSCLMKADMLTVLARKTSST